jgi:hypothetical protein
MCCTRRRRRRRAVKNNFPTVHAPKMSARYFRAYITLSRPPTGQIGEFIPATNATRCSIDLAIHDSRAGGPSPPCHNTLPLVASKAYAVPSVGGEHQTTGRGANKRRARAGSAKPEVNLAAVGIDRVSIRPPALSGPGCRTNFSRPPIHSTLAVGHAGNLVRSAILTVAHQSTVPL